MEIKVYIANLGKYNEGILQGEWFTLPVEYDEVKQAIGLNEQYEEFAIHDYEAPFSIQEFSSLKKLNEYAEELANISEDYEIIKAVFEYESSIERAIEILQNNEYTIYNECEKMSDVAYEIVEQNGLLENASELLIRYFDYEEYGRDLEIEGTYIKVNYNTYVEIHN